MSEILPDKHKTLNFLWLFLLTVGAFLVQGYHPFAEDAEIYLPGVEKILHPELFPVGREFFLSHAHLTFFPNVVALSLRVTHLPMEVGLLVWQIASIFLAAPRLLGVIWSVLPERQSAVGRSLSGCGIAVDPCLRHSALHH